MRCAAVASCSRDPLRAGLVARRRRPAGAAIALAVDGAAIDQCPDAGRGEHRAHVADRVAPALVELARLDDDVGDRAGRRSAADRDDRGPGAGRARGSKRAVGRAGAAFVRDADHEAARRGIERQLERLLGE